VVYEISLCFSLRYIFTFECGVNNLKTSRQLVNERHVISSRSCGHGDDDTHFLAELEVPVSALVFRHVTCAVDAFVSSCQFEAVACSLQAKIFRGVVHGQSEVQSARAFFCQDQVTVANVVQQLHGHVNDVRVSRAANVALFASKDFTEPDCRLEVGLIFLVDSKVLVQRNQNEAVLLRVVPTTGLTMCQKTLGDLGNDCVLLVNGQQRLEQDTVSSAVRMQHDIFAFLITELCDEVSSFSGLVGSVLEELSKKKKDEPLIFSKVHSAPHTTKIVSMTSRVDLLESMLIAIINHPKASMVTPSLPAAE
jgi:hypothetical protein